MPHFEEDVRISPDLDLGETPMMFVFFALWSRCSVYCLIHVRFVLLFKSIYLSGVSVDIEALYAIHTFL